MRERLKKRWVRKEDSGIEIREKQNREDARRKERKKERKQNRKKEMIRKK